MFDKMKAKKVKAKMQLKMYQLEIFKLSKKPDRVMVVVERKFQIPMTLYQNKKNGQFLSKQAKIKFKTCKGFSKMETICKQNLDVAKLLNMNVLQYQYDHYQLTDAQSRNQVFLKFSLELDVPGIQQQPLNDFQNTSDSKLTLNEIENTMLSTDPEKNELSEQDLQQLTKPQLIKTIQQLQKLYKNEKNKTLLNDIKKQQKKSLVQQPFDQLIPNPPSNETLRDKFFINLLVNELTKVKGQTKLSEIMQEVSKFKT